MVAGEERSAQICSLISVVMSSIPISIKHAGKTYTVPALDLTAPGAVFKAQIFELTGVDPSKVKVVVKGGMLKVRTLSTVPCS